MMFKQLYFVTMFTCSYDFICYPLWCSNIAQLSLEPSDWPSNPCCRLTTVYVTGDKSIQVWGTPEPRRHVRFVHGFWIAFIWQCSWIELNRVESSWMMNMMNEWWMNDEWMMNEWWMNDEWMMNEWWMNDEWMMNEWWMNDEWMMNEWWMNDEWMMNEWWMNDECSWAATELCAWPLEALGLVPWTRPLDSARQQSFLLQSIRRASLQCHTTQLCMAVGNGRNGLEFWHIGCIGSRFLKNLTQVHIISWNKRCRDASVSFDRIQIPTWNAVIMSWSRLEPF